MKKKIKKQRVEIVGSTLIKYIFNTIKNEKEDFHEDLLNIFESQHEWFSKNILERIDRNFEDIKEKEAIYLNENNSKEYKDNVWQEILGNYYEIAESLNIMNQNDFYIDSLIEAFKKHKTITLEKTKGIFDNYSFSKVTLVKAVFLVNSYGVYQSTFIKSITGIFRELLNEYKEITLSRLESGRVSIPFIHARANYEKLNDTYKSIDFNKFKKNFLEGNIDVKNAEIIPLNDKGISIIEDLIDNTIKDEIDIEDKDYKHLSWKELEKLAIEYGYNLERQTGDHGIFINKNGKIVVIPRGRDIGKGLQIKITKIIKEVE